MLAMTAVWDPGRGIVTMELRMRNGEDVWRVTRPAGSQFDVATAMTAFANMYWCVVVRGGEAVAR